MRAHALAKLLLSFPEDTDVRCLSSETMEMAAVDRLCYVDEEGPLNLYTVDDDEEFDQ